MTARNLISLISACILIFAFSVQAQEEVLTPQSESKAIERFELVLTRNPRAGIALDKVYEYHIQQGDLDRYLTELENRSKTESQNAAKLLAAMGLLENQRGCDQKAIEWLSKAESFAPKDAILSFYIAQSQVVVGQTNLAIASFERAVAKNPTRNDRLLIEESLGRLYLRTQQKVKAEAVWARLEAVYPNDIIVQERIAQANQAEGDIQTALERYERLAVTTRDAPRKIAFEAIIASLLRQLGRPKEAIEKYESLLAAINPESWRYKDLRRRIESIFLTTQDYDGWIRYLKGWLEKHPDDMDSHLRLAWAYNTVRKPELAERTLVDAIAKAPSNDELPLTLSQTYRLQKKFKEAATQLELLTKREPLKLEYRMQWGQMLADDPSGDKGANIKSAIAIWTDLPAALQVDAPSVLVVSKSLARLSAWGPAIALMEKASEKAPDDLGLVYELGELHLKAGHREMAIDTWQRMVAMPNDTNVERRRLAGIFRRNGMTDQAIELIQTVVAKPETSTGSQSSVELVSDYMSLAQLLASKRKTLECILAVSEALKRVLPDSSNTYFTELKGVLQLDSDPAAWSDFAQTQSIQMSPQGWITAATIWSSLGLKSNAIKLLNSVTAKMDEEPVWKTELLARTLDLYRDVQEYGMAIEVCNRLLAAPSRSRSIYLRQLAKLYLSNRQPAKAVESARALLDLSEAESRDYGECAAICIEANQLDEAIELLKTAVRKDPTFRAGYIQMADQFSKMGRYEESISANWKSFELAAGLPDQYETIRRLAPLYAQRRRMDELVGKLRERARSEQSDRLGALWASVAYQSVRNLYEARQELEPLVHGDTLDPSLIERLAVLAEADRDFTAMVTWQERLVQMEPSDVNRLKLGEYCNTAGDRQRACELYIDLVRNASTDSVRNTAMEYLYLGKHTPETIAFCEELSQSNDAPWQLRGIAFYLLQNNGKRAAADRIARSILEMPEPSINKLASLIPATITQGNYSVFKSTAQPAIEESELNAAVGMARIIGPKIGTRGSSSSSYWGPVSSFHQLRGAAKFSVYESMSEAERSALRTKVQVQLKTEQVADRDLHEALIMEIAFGERTPLRNSMMADAFLLSKDFRSIAKKLFDRGHLAGARLYVASNLSDLNLQSIDPEDLEIAVEVLKKGGVDAKYFSVISMVLKALQGKSRHQEVEELVAIISDTRDGSVLNAVKSFCASRKDKDMLAKLAEKQIRMLPTTQLYASAYYWPEYASLLLTGAETEKDFNLAGDFLTKCLEYQATVLSSQSLSQRQGFLSLIDTPVGLSLPKGEAGSEFKDKFLDSTFYLPLELQGLIAVLNLNTDSDEQKNRWWDRVRSIADEPLDVEMRQRQAVYRAAAFFIEHFRGNRDERAKYLALWKEAMDSPELIELLTGGIQYREKDYQACLRTCEQFVPTNFASQTGLTRLHLQAALKSGDIEISRRVALSMATTRLSLTDQVKLARTLGELQLNDKALELLGYVRYRMPVSILSEVMNAYDRLGDKATAVEIAQGLVRKSALEASWDQMQFSSGPNSRSDAIAYLAKHNGLAILKSEFQSQLDAAPGNERTAIQLANVCKAMGDLQTELTLRKKFGQSTQTAVRSDPLGVGKSISIADLKKLLESDPKSLSKLDSQSFNDFLYNDKSKQLADVVTPYLDKTGWCSIYASLVSNLESRRDPAVDGMVATLIESYGYRAIAEGRSTAHTRYLTEKATSETRKKLADTWVAYLRDPLARDYPAFAFLQANTTKIFVTPFLLDLLSAEATNYGAVCDEAKRLYEESYGNALAIDILLSAAIRAKDWDSARTFADAFDPGSSTYRYVSLAEAISVYPELAAQAWKALEIAEAKVPLTNQSFVQLYLKVAREQKQFAKLSALLDRVCERLVKPTTNGMITGDGTSASWQYELQSTIPILIENGRFAECWQLISLLKRQPETRLQGQRGSADLVASGFEKKVISGLTGDRAVECLIDATVQNPQALVRLSRLIESENEVLSLGIPYACSLEKLLQAFPPKPTTELQVKLTQLRTQLIATNDEPVISCVAKIRIAAQIDGQAEIVALTKNLLDNASQRPVSGQDAEATWYVAAMLLKAESTKASGEVLQQLICPASDKVESLVQYKIALERGLSEVSDSNPQSNPWLDQVLRGFETNTIDSDQIVDVAIRMAERGLATTSMKLARSLVVSKPQTPEKPLKQKVDTKRIAGLATAPALNSPFVVRENPTQVFSEPFREENLLASKIQRLIAIWQADAANSEGIAEVVEELVLQADRVWMGFVGVPERTPSPIRNFSRPGQMAGWSGPRAIGLETFAKLLDSDGSRKDRLTQRFNAPTCSLQDKLLLAMLEGSLVKSNSEYTELVKRILPLLRDDPASKTASGVNLTFLRWTLALQLLESTYANSIPQELIHVFLVGDYRFFNEGFTLAVKLQAAKWVLRSETPNAMEHIQNLTDSIADVGDRKDCHAVVARFAIEANRPDLALDMIYRGQKIVSKYGAFYSNCRELSPELLESVDRLPIAERYDLLSRRLLELTELVNGENDSKVIIAYCFQMLRPTDASPAWSKQGNPPRFRSLPLEQEVIGLVDYLISDAKALGKLPEVSQKIEIQAQSESLGGPALRAWFELALDRRPSDDLIKLALDKIDELNKPELVKDFTHSTPYLYVSLFEQLVRNGHSELAKKMMEPIGKLAEKVWDRALASRFLAMKARFLEANKGSSKDPSVANDLAPKPFKHWLSSSFDIPGGTRFGASPETRWSTDIVDLENPQNQGLRLLYGPLRELLILKYPLESDFRATVDVMDNRFSVGEFSYGGFFATSTEPSNQFTFSGGRTGFISPVAARNTSSTNAGKKKAWAFEVKNGNLRFLVDNEETTILDAGPFSEHPFLAFQSMLAKSHTFSNLVIQPVGSVGSVSVSPKVQMLGATMQGWSGEYSQSPLPDAAIDPKLQMGTLSSAGWQYRVSTSGQSKPWRFENDTLTATVPEKRNSTSWNCYHYQRPIDHGDSWQYEFWSEPGKSIVMPVIGRTAIHLDAESLEREWLVDKLDAYWLSTEAGKRVAIPKSNKPQLNQKAWNAIELRRDGKDVSIVLNGALAGTFEIEPNQQSYPGLYMPSGIREFSVRHMTLQGNWPSALPANLWERN